MTKLLIAYITLKNNKKIVIFSTSKYTSSGN